MIQRGMPTTCSSVLTKRSSTLMITDSTAGETRQYELTQLQKVETGKSWGLNPVGLLLLTIEDMYTPPRLHLVVRIFIPVVDSTYTMSQVEQERLVAWINTLSVGVLS